LNRLLLLTDEFPPDFGGIGTYTYEMARGLHGLGWGVSVLARQHLASPSEIATFNAAQPYRVLSTPHAINRQSAAAALRQTQATCILASDLNPLWAVRWSALWRRLPVVALAYGSGLRRSRPVRRLAKKYLYESCQQVILISQFAVDLMHQAGIHPRHYTIIHPGGDATTFKPTQAANELLRERYALGGKTVLLTVGALSERKGQAVVLHALKNLLPRYPHLHYVMVGRDRSDGAIPALVEQLGLSDSVTLAGVVPDAERAAFYNLAAFCLLTSQNTPAEVEGYGIVAIEAALCGKTTIGTYGTGTQEAIQGGVTGLLVPQRDPTATANAIQTLLDHPALCERLAQQAQRYAQAHATWQHRAQALHHLLRQI